VPPRTPGNYRAYDPDHLHRLGFIRRCRDLGFSLDQVRDLLRLSSQEHQPCDEVNRTSTKHLTEIEHKIADLTRLAGKLRRCKGGRTIAAFCWRPFSTTAAPACANPLAIAKPMPPVDPVTIAVFSERSIFILLLP
jgi:DNA-binding transcriptional MerR regulator